MRIRIVGTPPGQAPEWVRQAWIGLVFNAKPESRGVQMGVLGGKPENLGGYEVDGEEAIRTLRLKDKNAVNWWLKYVPQVVSTYLVFTRDVCEIVES